MTTTVIVQAAGHDVKVGRYKPGSAVHSTEYTVPAGDSRSFHVWGDLVLSVQEIPTDETTTEDE